MKRWFENRKIGFRIMAGFLLAIIIAVIVGGFGIVSLQTVNGSYKVSYTDTVTALECTERISSSFQGIRMNLYGVVLSDVQKEKESYVEKINAFKQEIDIGLNRYRDMLGNYPEAEVAREREFLENVQDRLIEFGEKRLEFLDELAMDASRRTAAFEGLKDGGEIISLASRVDKAIEELIEYNRAHAESRIKANANLMSNTRLIMIIVVIVGIILATFMALYISKDIIIQIRHIVKATEALALGDVNVQVVDNRRDEFGVVAKAFKEMVANIRDQAQTAEMLAAGDLTVDANIRSDKDILGQKLHEIIVQNNNILNDIISAADQVAAGSRQVSDSSMALSHGAAEQASTVEELTAALEEISAQTKHNAENANQANELAEVTRNNAEQGNSQMQDMLRAMEEINESSTKISKVIKVIDDIAFQTNILALNAAVEAARAGQHGRGFAVVAEEVRNLAARSAEAAKETTDMIEGSINKTKGGTKIANQTAASLTRIVDDVTKAAMLISDIATASNEQATGIAQINQGIVQVSQVVQTNSATSEESAAASEELSSQAAHLKEMMGRFKLKPSSGFHDDFEKPGTDTADGEEDISEKGSPGPGQLHESHEEAAAGKAEIDLDNRDFGKY
ncbi:MAG: methyl-accepting chemotaxis protein [Clostridiales bacterium]|nr:methyl-accepting chemotaxis protein [Clostridiales bacterium]